MTCLACGKTHSEAIEVTLHDGRVVSSYSEDWRHETEARAVLALPTKFDRASLLKNIERHRGKETADALKATVTTLWNLQLANQRAAG